MKNTITCALLGAGSRGREVFGRYILEHPGEVTAVAVAEPDDKKRALFAQEHNINPDYQFNSWEQLLTEDKLADIIIIATSDTMHVEPTLKALERGYEILLEKPIAPTLEGTLKIARAVKDTDIVLVAHVMRYTPFYQKLKELLDNKVIGEIRFVDHIENIGYFHFAHSFVRGNWRNTTIAAPIILAKTCHDLDLLYWLLGKRCLELSSQASLEYFKAVKKPQGAGERCLMCGIEKECPYSAAKLYLTENTGWPTSVISTDLSYQGRYKALKEGPYGRCVFNCDNNVPEVQTVRMLFENNVEVNFALTAFSEKINRTSRFYGTLGEIKADFEEGIIRVYKFGQTEEQIKMSVAGYMHGGGDIGLMDTFVRIVKGHLEPDDNLTNISASVESHLMAFAAEIARKEGRIVKLAELRD